MSKVDFNYQEWAKAYPELARSFREAQAIWLFDEATLYLDASDDSIVKNPNRRKILLYMLVAHLAQLRLQSGIDNDGGASLVGRITKISTGSVSIGTTLNTASSNAEWFAQTPYGYAVWQAMLPYRSARYIPRRPNRRHPFYP